MSGEHYNASLLISEPPLQVLPTLAEAIGLENAIVYQQLYYLLRKPEFGRVVNGKRWIFNTYADWHAMFPFWSERTIRRIFESLETMHLVESCQPEQGISRRKYYRLNEGMLERAKTGRFVKPVNNGKIPCGQFGHIDRPIEALPITKTTCKDYESKETGQSPAEAFGDLKMLKFQHIKRPRIIPSLHEFDLFVGNNDLMEIIDKRGVQELYEKMVADKWHEWDGVRWKPIRYWQKYVTALNEHMSH